MADIIDTLKAWADWYGDENAPNMPSTSLPAAMLNAVTEIEVLRLTVAAAETTIAAADKIIATLNRLVEALDVVDAIQDGDE